MYQLASVFLSRWLRPSLWSLATLAVVAASSLDGQAQTCTLGPYCGDTPTGCGSSSSLSQISDAINAAPDGAVVCLRRGQVWNVAGGLSLQSSHPDANRVTICSSDAAQCTSSGDARAQINITIDSKNVDANWGCGVRTSGGAGGFMLRNLTWTGPFTVTPGSQNVGACIDRGSRDITFDGGKIDTFETLVWLNDGSGANPANIRLGTCANPMEWTGDQ
ncbi:MAG: hypothetical protein ACHQ6T_02150, partial [Myxococcota bacterium]